ncbi:hypothetical protein LIER_08512 [Lithospermum erythrorhizon]|uniref:Uncharacterized protein n=1 Tax=Lithospermum erythrorhizon TaxID=34254 RepID=A0AAV3PD15_LITER
MWDLHENTYKWLARRYVNKVKICPKIALKNFIGDIFEDMKVEISTTTAWKAIKEAGYLMFGNENHCMGGGGSGEYRFVDMVREIVEGRFGHGPQIRFIGADD